MEEQVALFLFRYKHCVLPGVGQLQVQHHAAVYSGVNENIAAPVPYIQLLETDTDSKELVSFIAGRNNISEKSAALHLDHFIEKIRSVKSGEEVEIPSAGKFVVDSEGVLQFISYTFPKEMFPLVDAKTIIRTQDHAILVGDKEVNAIRMTAYYSEQGNTKKQWWKLAAAILFIAAAGYLSYYFIYQQHRGGNIQKLEIGKEPATYSVP